MKRFVLMAAVIGVWLSVSNVFAQEILPVENWIKIGEERQVLNKDYGSGLVRRYYVDPNQQNGVGSTLAIFYKDGSEELFWKGWNLYTENGKFALLYQGQFVLQPISMRTTLNMRTLKDLTNYISAKVLEQEYNRNGEFYLPSLRICLVVDQNLKHLKTVEGLSICYEMFFTRNTKP